MWQTTSGGDEQTVFNALRRYSFPKFLLCIANLRPEVDGGWRTNYKVNVGCFLFTPSYSHYQTGAWVVLPSQSPIRKDLEWSEARMFFYSPTLNKNWNVERTTLEEQRLISTEPIEISRDIWYSTPRGRALLKEIFEGLKSRYENCEMFRTPSEQIYFTFEKKLTYGNFDQWRLELPNNFPQSSARIKVNHLQLVDIKNWCGDFEQLKQIEACIQRYYDGQWST